MSRFLVTGGAGFIGSHIVEELLRRKEDVCVLDNFSSGKRENLSAFKGKLEVFKGDIRFEKDCRKACRGVDFVMHQAALRSVPRSMSEPGEYNEVNIGGVLNMLEAARLAGVRKFVFASSSSVYGDVDVFPEKEYFYPHPISPYALTKLAGEYYCSFFSHHYGMPAIALRYFNVFGPRQALDDEYAVVIPKFINCILQGKSFPVYGTGRQSRDFTFVSNVVDANILAAKNKTIRYGVFNIASGKDYSVLELSRAINLIAGKKVRPLFLKKRPGDVYRTLADLSLANKVIKFRPRVTFLEGLRITVSYWRKICAEK